MDVFCKEGIYPLVTASQRHGPGNQTSWALFLILPQTRSVVWDKSLNPVYIINLTCKISKMLHAHITAVLWGFTNVFGSICCPQRKSKIAAQSDFVANLPKVRPDVWFILLLPLSSSFFMHFLKISFNYHSCLGWAWWGCELVLLFAYNWLVRKRSCFTG